MTNLQSLFNPKSVAIFGVSEDPTKLGSVLLSNLVKAKYSGEIYPINPKHAELYGFKSYSKVTDVPFDVEMACIVVPAKFVEEILTDCGKKGVKSAIIISAGFKELGGEGIEMENRIKEIGKQYGIKILGPNCLGAIIPKNGVNVSFAASSPREGNVAFLSQSGAVCTAMLDMSLERNVGFSHFVSFGNKSDINENDLIEDWLEDEDVKVIGGYIEEIESGKTMVDIYKRHKAIKPIILFKPGETQEAQKAISSHTGSMAGSMQTFKTAMNEAGIIIANEINQMFYLMMSLSWAPLPKGNRVAVVTNAGGPGIIATDSIVRNGLQMAKISDETKEKIKPFLPPTASLHNPIDVIGDALAERYKAPIDVLIKDDNVDAILVILTPQLVTQIEETAKLIINTAKLSDKPIFAVFIGGKYTSFGLQRLYDEKIPVFRYVNDAVDVLAKMHQFYKYQQSGKASVIPLDNMKGEYFSEVQTSTTNETKALAEDLVTKLAAEVGIELPRQIVAENLNDGLNFAKDKYPVVLKATTDVIAHKTDKKALYLNIKSDEEFTQSYTELENMIRQEFGVSSPKILIQEMIKAEEEVFIGTNRDGGSNVYGENNKGFGHLIAFGKGGIYTEIYQDINYVLAPSTKEEILEAFNKTKVSKIVAGARGKEPLALEKLINMIEAVQQLVLKYPQIESLDINPVLLTKDRAVCVDLKVFVRN